MKIYTNRIDSFPGQNETSPINRRVQVYMSSELQKHLTRRGLVKLSRGGYDIHTYQTRRYRLIQFRLGHLRKARLSMETTPHTPLTPDDWRAVHEDARAALHGERRDFVDPASDPKQPATWHTLHAAAPAALTLTTDEQLILNAFHIWLAQGEPPYFYHTEVSQLVAIIDRLARADNADGG